MAKGQRSLGCATCRKRKIRCDQARPKCAACVRSKLQCGGYRDEYAFEIRTADSYKDKSRATIIPEAIPDANNHKSEATPAESESNSSSSSNDTSTVASTSPGEQTQSSQSSFEFVEDESLKRLRTCSNDRMTQRHVQRVKRNSTRGEPSRPKWAITCGPHVPIVSINSPTMFRVATIAAMQRAYIPKLPPGLAKSGPQFQNGAAATGLWLSSCFALMQMREIPVLQDALLAMSIVFLAKSPDNLLRDSRLQRAHAAPVYSIALRRLQVELNTLDVVKESERLDACLLASFACAWYEMLGESSLENMRTHMAGVGALLRQLGVRRIKSQTALAVLAEYRMTNIWSCFQLRQTGFLSSEEWLYRSWGPDDGRPLSRIQILLDIAYSIPPAMEAYDKAIGRSHGRPTAELELSVREQLTAMTAIETGIHVWAGSESCSGQQKPTHWMSSGPYTEYFAYSDLTDGLAWIYYLTIKMVVLKQMIDMKNILVSREVRERIILSAEINQHRIELMACAEAIFGSMEYFFEKDQGFAGPAVSMVPFLIAYRYTAETLRYASDPQRVQWRLLWCSKVRERYVVLGFPV